MHKLSIFLVFGILLINTHGYAHSNSIDEIETSTINEIIKNNTICRVWGLGKWRIYSGWGTERVELASFFNCEKVINKLLELQESKVCIVDWVSIHEFMFSLPGGSGFCPERIRKIINN